MPSALEVRNRNGDVQVDGELGKFVSQMKDDVITVGKEIYTVADVLRLAFPDKNSNFISEQDRRKLARGMQDYPPEKPYRTCLPEVPTTIERRPYYPQDGDRLIDPGTARANIAATREAPNGTLQDDWASKHEHETVVQQHCVYWDQDHDGIIWPSDTYRGFRAWGWAIPLCLFATFVINVNLSYPTGPSFIPDPFFRIYIANVHKDKHGSDSMSYDNEGRFRPQNFEDFFAKYDRENKGGLTIRDLARALKGQRMAFDLFGMAAATLEWLAVYLLLWPEDGICRKEDIRRVFDGSIFQYKADEYAEKQRKKNKIA